MPYLELFDETLDINSTENYGLSIEVSHDRLSFCLLDAIRNKYVLIRVFEPEDNKYYTTDSLKELFVKDDFLLKHYKDTRLIMPSSKFTLVPAPLYDPAKKDEYFLFNHKREDDKTIITNKLHDPDSFLVFSVSKQLTDLLNTFYTGIYPWHHLKPLFNHLSHNRKSRNGNYIHIHIERDFFNMIVYDNNILKFCNSFNYRNISDILYFVLNVFKKLDLNQEETIIFSGLTEKYDDLSSNFSIYVRNIKFAEPTGNFTFSYVFNDADLHHYLNLFNASNCE